jgi:dolichol-phosphate mannosyltransferase
MIVGPRRIGLGTVLRMVTLGLALTRIVRAAHRRPPLMPLDVGTVDRALDANVDVEVRVDVPTVSVVIPARDEAIRIPPLLDALADAGVEVIVVDDQSSDGTASLAAAAGAVVVHGDPLPDGWAGKAWALQQGIEAATGEWVVTLDADTRPHPSLPRAVVARAIADRLDMVTVGGRFECPTRGATWLHAAMLTTLVYRFGPAGAVHDPGPERQLANGQCTAFRRRPFLDAGGMALVRAEVVEDVALARALARSGWQVAMLDGAEVLTTRMFDDLGHTWHGWQRSLALPGVEPISRQLFDLAIVVGAQVVPLPRFAAGLLRGRLDLIDLIAVMMRLGTLGGTARAYTRAGWSYWLSPTADVVAAGAIASSILDQLRHRPHTWRGRTYPS